MKLLFLMRVTFLMQRWYVKFNRTTTITSVAKIPRYLLLQEVNSNFWRLRFISSGHKSITVVFCLNCPFHLSFYKIISYIKISKFNFCRFPFNWSSLRELRNSTVNFKTWKLIVERSVIRILHENLESTPDVFSHRCLTPKKT